jgi:hypothetical protein
MTIDHLPLSAKCQMYGRDPNFALPSFAPLTPPSCRVGLQGIRTPPEPRPADPLGTGDMTPVVEPHFSVFPPAHYNH